jgi:hypothetical protein
LTTTKPFFLDKPTQLKQLSIPSDNDASMDVSKPMQHADAPTTDNNSNTNNGDAADGPGPNSSTSSGPYNTSVPTMPMGFGSAGRGGRFGGRAGKKFTSKRIH